MNIFDLVVIINYPINKLSIRWYKIQINTEIASTPVKDWGKDPMLSRLLLLVVEGIWVADGPSLEYDDLRSWVDLKKNLTRFF